MFWLTFVLVMGIFSNAFAENSEPKNPCAYGLFKIHRHHARLYSHAETAVLEQGHPLEIKRFSTVLETDQLWLGSIDPLQASLHEFLIFRKNDHRYIGNSSLNTSELDKGRAPVFLNEEFLGFGYGAEAKRALLEAGFGSKNVTSFEAIIDADNVRSQRLHKAFGFEYSPSANYKPPKQLYLLTQQRYFELSEKIENELLPMGPGFEARRQESLKTFGRE